MPSNQQPLASDALSSTMTWIDSNAALLGRTAAIPLIPGKKNPMVPYKDNAWTQETARAFVEQQRGAPKKHSDYGLLLDRLFVVDADDEETVDRLEGLARDEFPELSRCPCQSTRKGRHYVFLRSEFSDTEGYWNAKIKADGMKGDLKTRYANGTPSVLAVEPSPDKKCDLSCHLKPTAATKKPTEVSDGT